MDITTIWDDLAWAQGGRIVYLVLDGLGGIPHPATGCTELQAANTPNLDALARESSCGLLEIVGPGITPGSGPGHLTLFGYDPLKYRVGRGVLSALGIDFDLQPGGCSRSGQLCYRRLRGAGSRPPGRTHRHRFKSAAH